MTEDARPSGGTPGPQDDADELLDVLDEAGRPTGHTKPRAAVHRDGDWHRAFHLWIVDGDDHVLLQRRSPHKDLAGGKLDVTVGGHLRAGEYWPNALREVEEELGLRVEVRDIDALGTFREERVYQRAVDREFHEVFVMRCAQPLQAYLLNPREVDALYAVPIPGAMALWRDGRPVFARGWDCQRRPSDALLHEGDLIEEGREGTLAALSEVASWAGVDVEAGPAEP
ncbi:MAG: NUDIX domain-containing protein [Trueperaceae bacterium]|nr:NUDIX domain-containing protein [Trueperaceae bacterium]